MNKATMILMSLIMVGCSSQDGVVLKDQPTNSPNNSKILSVSKETKIDYTVQSKVLKENNIDAYFLKEINKGGVPVSETPVNMIFIEKEGLQNVVKGFNGCNDYYFKYDIKNDYLKIGETVTTNFKCSENSALFEYFLFEELNKTPKIIFTDYEMIIENNDYQFIWSKNNEYTKEMETFKEENLINEEELLEETAYKEDLSEKEEDKKFVSANFKEIKIIGKNKDYPIYSKGVGSKEYLHLNKNYKENEKSEYIEQLSLSSSNFVKEMKLNKNDEFEIVEKTFDNGDVVPFFRYKVKKLDSIKMMVLSSYKKDPKWSSLMSRIKSVKSFNIEIKNIDKIYPEQIIYIPVFKNIYIN